MQSICCYRFLEAVSRFGEHLSLSNNITSNFYDVASIYNIPIYFRRHEIIFFLEYYNNMSRFYHVIYIYLEMNLYNQLFENTCQRLQYNLIFNSLLLPLTIKNSHENH